MFVHSHFLLKTIMFENRILIVHHVHVHHMYLLRFPETHKRASRTTEKSVRPESGRTMVRSPAAS